MSDCRHGGRDVPLRPRTLKSLEDMRSSLVGYRAVTGEDMGAFLLHADAIQAEVDSRYMQLPVDADGMPIHPGDKLKSIWINDGKGVQVEGVNGDEVFVRLGDIVMSCDADKQHHVKPRTVEDVLREFADEATDIDGRDDEEWIPMLVRYANELRGMIEVRDD